MRFGLLLLHLATLFSSIYAQAPNETHFINGESIVKALGSIDEEVITQSLLDSIPGLYAVASNMRADTIFVISKYRGENFAVIQEIPVANPQDYSLYPIKNELGERYRLGPCFSLTQNWSTGELVFNDIGAQSLTQPNTISSSQVVSAYRGKSNEYIISSRVDYDYLPFLDLIYTPWYGVIGIDRPDDPSFNGRPFIQIESKSVLSYPQIIEEVAGAGLGAYPYGEIAVYDSKSVDPSSIYCSLFDAATGVRLSRDTFFNPIGSGEGDVFDAASSWPDSLYVSMSFEEQELSPCQRSKIRIQVIDARRSGVIGDSIQLDMILPEGLTVTGVLSTTGTLIAWQQVGPSIILSVPWTEHPIKDFDIVYNLESSAITGAYTVQADVFVAESTTRYTQSDEPLLAGKRNASPFRVLPIDNTVARFAENFDLCSGEEIAIEIPHTWIRDFASWDDGDASIPMRTIDEGGLYSATVSTECGEQYYTAAVRKSEGEVELTFEETACSLADLVVYSATDYPISQWQLDIAGETIQAGEQLPNEFESDPFRNDDTIRLLVTDELGCQYESSVEAKISSCIGFPNAFSPDGNAINDRFGPKSELEITGTLMIFDRWGNQVFIGRVSTLNESGFWDGTFNGKPAQNGVYVFTFEIDSPEDMSQNILSGDITLLR